LLAGPVKPGSRDLRAVDRVAHGDRIGRTMRGGVIASERTSSSNIPEVRRSLGYTPALARMVVAE
jgi:hypothetical protein